MAVIIGAASWLSKLQSIVISGLCTIVLENTLVFSTLVFLTLPVREQMKRFDIEGF